MEKHIKKQVKRICASLLAVTLLTSTVPYTPIGELFGSTEVTASAKTYDGWSHVNCTNVNTGDIFEAGAELWNNTGNDIYLYFPDDTRLNCTLEKNDGTIIGVKYKVDKIEGTKWTLLTELRTQSRLTAAPSVNYYIPYDGTAKTVIKSGAAASGGQTVYYGLSTYYYSQPSNWYSDISNSNLKVTDKGEYYLWIKTNGNSDYLPLSPSVQSIINVTDQASFFEMALWETAEGTQSDPFIISDAADWDFLCEALNYNDIFNRFKGKYFKLENNITVSTMAGSSNHDFCGNFDGNNKTINFNCNSTDVDGAALFSYISNVDNYSVTIKNLNVNCNITTSATHASGLVGRAWGILNIDHCTVSGTINTSNKYACGFVGELNNSPANITDCKSSITINSSIDGDGTHGGFVGRTKSSSTAYITGCLFNGKLLGENTTSCGGFIGYNGGTESITNSLYAPNHADGDKWVKTDNSATFTRNGSSVTNSYCTETLGTAQGKKLLSISKGNNVTELSITGTPCVYNTAGITVFSNNSGIKYNNNFYAGNGDTVSLELAHADVDRYAFKNYSATNGSTVSGTTLTMGSSDTEVTAVYKQTSFRVIWRNYDHSYLREDYYTEGQTPRYTAGTPSRPSTAYTYFVFEGWDKELTPIHEDTEYIATYREEQTPYLVWWFDYQGNVTHAISAPWDGPHKYPGESDPTRPDEGAYTYTFTGWERGSTIIGNGTDYRELVITYTPQFQKTQNKYNITWKNDDGTVLRTDKNVLVGTTPSYGSTPTKASDEKYNYTFKEWSPAVTAVSGDTVYTAVYTKTPNTAHFSVSGDTYTIRDDIGWEIFCECLQDSTYNCFSGKSVQLKNNITASKMAGDNSHRFKGTFIGNSKTLTFNYTGNDDYTAPFRYTENAVIDSLKVTGTIVTSNKHAAGVVGYAFGTTSITGSYSEIVINSSVNGDGTHAGFIAATGTNSDVSISGCIFKGSIASVGENITTTCCGGFVGWNNSKVTLKNCLFAPADVSTIGTSDSYTFVRRGGDCTFTKCYYTTTLGSVQGKQPRQITAGDYVEINRIMVIGGYTSYSFGLQAYENGGLAYTTGSDTTLYFGSEDKVAIEVSHADREGYDFVGYALNAGTLENEILTMPDEDVIIGAEYEFIDGISGIAGHSLTLSDGDIGVYFYMELDTVTAQSETAVVQFNVNGDIQTVPVTEAVEKTVDGKTLYGFKCNVAAKDMTTPIKAQVVDGDNAGTEFTYSVNDYAKTIINNPDNNPEFAAAAPLVQAMLNYGEYAANYFSDDDALDAPQAEIPEKTYTEALPKGVTFDGATLSLKTKVTLSLYFISDNDLTLSCSEKEFETDHSGNEYVIRIRNISAEEMNDNFTVTVTANGQRGTVTYSPMTYCYKAANSETSSEKLKNMVKALYLYWQEADKYFDQE